jgi:hypothetical protein
MRRRWEIPYEKPDIRDGDGIEWNAVASAAALAAACVYVCYVD